MPRKARNKSETGIYHVILRGINRQIIFEDEEDNMKFLQKLAVYKQKCGYKLYAYCLMGNHIHLLIHVHEEELGLIMKRIGTSYVYWYNSKYNRSGHLFQDRYKSEVVDSESYLLTVLRYIHQNPLKAGIVKYFASYKWSSYNEYTGKSGNTDIDFILEIFDKDRNIAIESFETFHRESNNDKCLELEEKRRLADDEAMKIIEKICNINNCFDIQNFERQEKEKLLKELKEAGLSTRQIAKLTGISRAIVLKA